MYWGITPALDFQELYKENCKVPKVFNILIVGGADARHIIKTISQLYQHEPVQINFYVVEYCIELIARQLLLLNIALEPPEQLGLMSKTKIFMELYGNTLVRPAVAQYLTIKAKQFIEMITNEDYCHNVMPIINYKHLQYRERDYLEVLLKYWYSSTPFSICQLWDRRLRQHLGIRYDSRMGVADWDLHMRLHPAGAKQICLQEYKHWRGTGVAFTWLESEVSKPNRTLVAGVVPSGEKFVHHGYLGDIESGPFIAYGLYCKDKEMLLTTNHINIHRATDITEYNLMHIFYEIINKEECPYKTNGNVKMGTVVVDLPNERIVENNMHENESKFINHNIKHDTKCMDVENIKVNLISQTLLHKMRSREEFKNFFDIVYYSHMWIDKIVPDVVEFISNTNCLLIIENQNYIPSNRKEQLDELANKISTKITAIQNATAMDFNPQQDCYAKFVIT